MYTCNPKHVQRETSQERSTATAEHGGPKAKHSDRNLCLDRVGHVIPDRHSSKCTVAASVEKTSQERSTATAEHGCPKAKHSDRNLGLDRVGHIIPDRHSSKCTVAASVSRTPRRSQNKVCGGSDSGNFPENRVQWSPPSCAPCLRAHSRYDVRYTTYMIRQTGYDIRDITTYICVKHEVEVCKATYQ